MRRILGRAAALALIAGLCATIPTAGATSRVHTAPALTLPAHADGLSRALASGRISPAKEALLRAQALFHPARVAAVYGPVAPPDRRRGDDDPARPGASRFDGLLARRPQAAHGILARPGRRIAPTAPATAGRRRRRPLSPACGAEHLRPLGERPATMPAGHRRGPDTASPTGSTQRWRRAEHVWDVEVERHGLPGAALRATPRAPTTAATASSTSTSATSARGLYGYCTSDDPTLTTAGTITATPPTACSTTTTRRRSSAESHPDQNLKVTSAHEFFHAVQFAYDIGEDPG